MAGMPVNRILTILFVLSLVGCAQFRRSPPRSAVIPVAAAEAPRVKLPTEDKSVISMVSSTTAPRVTVVDARPNEEKLYYPGQTDPHHWRDAVTVLPMESFQPGINQRLKQELAAKLLDAGQYQMLVCEVTSFHVALDERERAESDLLYRFKTWDDARIESEAAAERDRQREEELRQQRLSFGHEDEKKSVADAVAAVIFNAIVVKPIKSEIANAEKARKKTVYPQTIPVSLTDGKQPGWNCQLSVTLKGHMTDGRRVDTPLQVTTHQLKDASLSVEEQMQRIVMAAIEKLTQQAVAAGM